jgi:hypothetical protein
MPHLLTAKYAPPARAQMHAKTAIPRFIVSIPVAFLFNRKGKNAEGVGRAPRQQN